MAGPELTLVARSELGLRLGLVTSLDLGIGMGLGARLDLELGIVFRLPLELVGLAARLDSGLGQLARSLARPGTMSGLESPSGV